ncbi:hypothetical protein [Pannonibacter phragmitetus]|uniref:Uncharacterized protein n=1 Tax=Pannonibacter phragmitetus TaxID=121719 RepID=A0A0U2W745_9HYPH|nr:hypothetical protein [Pannonibacter phragmitetus]ALV28266.1 hypothetical protein APZ00_15330 [Pannonibacter phragmitetus]
MKALRLAARRARRQIRRIARTLARTLKTALARTQARTQALPQAGKAGRRGKAVQTVQAVQALRAAAVVLPLTFAAALAAVVLMGSGSGQKDVELARIDCARLVIFAPAGRIDAQQACKAHGGLAAKTSEQPDAGLTILIRNQPAGGFEGRDAVPGPDRSEFSGAGQARAELSAFRA